MRRNRVSWKGGMIGLTMPMLAPMLGMFVVKINWSIYLMTENKVRQKVVVIKTLTLKKPSAKRNGNTRINVIMIHESQAL